MAAARLLAVTPRRAFVTAAAVGAAILGPWVLWDGSPRTAREPDGPERVLAARLEDMLPLGCPPTRSCCDRGLEIGVLVQKDAIWIGTSWFLQPPLRIVRDGREWETFQAVLHEMPPRAGIDFRVAVGDDTTYEDFLTAAVLSREVDLSPRLVTPALPVYPHHGHGGGLPPFY